MARAGVAASFAGGGTALLGKSALCWVFLPTLEQGVTPSRGDGQIESHSVFIPSCPIFLSQLIYKYCVWAASYAALHGVPGIHDVRIHGAAPELRGA